MQKEPFKIVKNKDPKLCVAYRCKNKKGSKDRFCPKHRKRYMRVHNPESYYFNLLRGNAKRRGKDFKLTLADFKKFCKAIGYLEKKGKTGKSASIDRIDPSKGYEVDNIQVLSLADNVRKRFVDQIPF